jgi:uncharacterized membrane protein
MRRDRIQFSKEPEYVKEINADSTDNDKLTLIFTKLSLVVFFAVGVILVIAAFLYSAGY